MIIVTLLAAVTLSLSVQFEQCHSRRETVVLALCSFLRHFLPFRRLCFLFLDGENATKFRTMFGKIDKPQTIFNNKDG